MKFVYYTIDDISREICSTKCRLEAFCFVVNIITLNVAYLTEQRLTMLPFSKKFDVRPASVYCIKFKWLWWWPYVEMANTVLEPQFIGIHFYVSSHRWGIALVIWCIYQAWSLMSFTKMPMTFCEADKLTCANKHTEVRDSEILLMAQTNHNLNASLMQCSIEHIEAWRMSNIVVMRVHLITTKMYILFELRWFFF